MLEHIFLMVLSLWGPFHLNWVYLSLSKPSIVGWRFWLDHYFKNPWTIAKTIAMTVIISKRIPLSMKQNLCLLDILVPTLVIVAKALLTNTPYTTLFLSLLLFYSFSTMVTFIKILIHCFDQKLLFLIQSH